MIPIDKLKEAVEIADDIVISLENHRRGLDEKDDYADFIRFKVRLEAMDTLIDLAQSVIDGTIFASDEEIRDKINNWLKRLSETDEENYPHIIDIDYHDISKLIKALVGKVPQGNIGREELIEIIRKHREYPYRHSPIYRKEEYEERDEQLADAILTKLTERKER